MPTSAISPGAAACCRSPRWLLFLLVWWQSVEIFDIKPFIAPSPVAVAKVLYERFDMLMANLLPTAIEAVCGFLLGNLAAITLATVFV